LEQATRFRGANFFWLMHGDTCCDCGGFIGEAEIACRGPGAVGLGDYGGDFDVGLGEEVDEGGDGEVRGAAEKEAHGLVGRRARDYAAMQCFGV